MNLKASTPACRFAAEKFNFYAYPKIKALASPVQPCFPEETSNAWIHGPG
jgi:hypothetical protein